VDRPAKAGAEPAPAAGPAPAGATAVQLEASGPGAAPRRTSGRFSVQVASVRDRAAIPALWASLAGHQRGLTDLEPQAPQAVTLPGRGTFYRVLAGSFAARSDAQAACDRLRSSGTRCVVVAS
jgi:cell division septation protein DedD